MSIPQTITTIGGQCPNCKQLQTFSIDFTTGPNQLTILENYPLGEVVCPGCNHTFSAIGRVRQDMTYYLEKNPHDEAYYERAMGGEW